jgi:hypothetical protein
VKSFKKGLADDDNPEKAIDKQAPTMAATAEEKSKVS